MASRPIARITAVTPEPQVVIIGLSVSIPAFLKASAIFSGDARRPFSMISVEGTLRAPGMWPERRPGRGSGSLPAKRPAERASTTWALLSLSAICTSLSIATAPVSMLALKVRDGRLTSPVSSGRPSCVQAGRPPSRTKTLRAPKILNVHQTRGAEKKPAAVIDDDRVILRNAEVSNRLSELAGAGQHVRQVGRIVCDGIDVEKDRTWNMPGKIFGLRVPLLCGQIVGAIDNGDARLAELADQPFGRLEPAARC